MQITDRKIHKLTQGSPEWLAHRQQYLNASEAPAMQGLSKYQTRSALLKEKATGERPEVDGATQRLFDKGHAFEAQARALAEEIIGEELYPMVMTATVEGLPLGASFDGLTMGQDIHWEHKSRNERLVEFMHRSELPPEYYPQVDQQFILSGAERCLFMASNGTHETMIYLWVKRDPQRERELIAGWQQFQRDLQDWKADAVAMEKPVGADPEALPALTIELVGEVRASNLVVYQDKALAFVRSINTDLVTDQDFADAEKLVKFCDRAEKELEQVKQEALGQTADIAALFAAVDTLKAELRTKRLALDKLVKDKKFSLKKSIEDTAFEAALAHCRELSAGLMMPGLDVTKPASACFAEATKGKRSLTSMQEAVDAELARLKTAATLEAAQLAANIAVLQGSSKDHMFLFTDAPVLMRKERETLELIIEQRIKAYQEAEQRKAADAAKAREVAQIAPIREQQPVDLRPALDMAAPMSAALTSTTQNTPPLVARFERWFLDSREGNLDELRADDGDYVRSHTRALFRAFCAGANEKPF